MLSESSHPRATAPPTARASAGADRCAGNAPGEFAAPVGPLLTGRCSGQHRAARLGGRVAPQAPRGRVVPHTSIDTQAGWTKSGWHGWVYGWKLHLATTVAAVWIPLAARLTPANVGDNLIAPELIKDLPPEAHFNPGRLALQRPERARGLRARAPAGNHSTGSVSAYGRRGGGVPHLPQAAQRLDRELLTSTSRPSSTCIARSPRRGMQRLRALLWVPCSSTRSLCCTDTSTASR